MNLYENLNLLCQLRFVNFFGDLYHKANINDVIQTYHWSIKIYVYWPAIGNLVCVLAYHWTFKWYDVIFYRHHKRACLETLQVASKQICIKVDRSLFCLFYLVSRVILEELILWIFSFISVLFGQIWVIFQKNELITCSPIIKHFLFFSLFILVLSIR